MRLSPLAAIAAACVLTLTACGDDGSDDPEGSTSPSSSEAKAGEGGEDGSGNDGVPGTNICGSLEADEVGDIFGSELKKGDLTEGTSCTFNDPDIRSGVTVGVSQSQVAGDEQFDAFRQLLGSFAKGKPEEVSDVGDRAVMTVGKGLTGNTASAAVVQFGDAIVQLNVSPISKMPKDDLRDQTIELLELVADKF